MEETRRSYMQYCGVARTLDFVGERWTLLILRDLLLSPRRFTDLIGGLPGLTTNLLSRRLKQMELDGLITKDRLPPPTPAVLYRLAPAGEELAPLIQAACDWGSRFLVGPSADEHRDIGWVLPRLKSRYRGDYQLLVELRVEGRAFRFELTPNELLVHERESPDAELIISGDFSDIHELFFGPATASEIVARGGLVVEGKFGRWPKLLAALGLR